MGEHTELKRLAEQDELLNEISALTKALTGLTCGGSEFFCRKGDRYVADVKACVEYVQRTSRDAHERWLSEAKQRRSLIEENERMRKAAEGLISALNRFGFPVSGAARVRLCDHGSSEAMAVDYAARALISAIGGHSHD